MPALRRRKDSQMPDRRWAATGKDQSAVERLVQRRGKRYAKLMGKGILSSWLVVVMVCALIRVVGKGF